MAQMRMDLENSATGIAKLDVSLQKPILAEHLVLVLARAADARAADL
jgi:hypothetical protein